MHGRERGLLCHLLLGLLRVGDPRHGYRLMKDYRAHVGEPANAGSIYRGLRRLAAEGLVTKALSPPETDARRIRYEITDEGRRVFDAWLARPRVDDTNFAVWMLFIDRVPVAPRKTVLDRREEYLRMRLEGLAREQLQGGAQQQSGVQGTPLPAPLARRLKLLDAELEFIRRLGLEFRGPLDSCSQTEGPVGSSLQTRSGPARNREPHDRNAPTHRAGGHPSR